MRLGIFGDSFSASDDPRSWPIQLMKSLKCDEYHNYSKSGTSLYYSYKLFLDHYKKYDIIIFTVTDPLRYTKPFIINNETNYICNVYMIHRILVKYKAWFKHNIIEQNKIKRLENWFLFQDQDYTEDMHGLMLSRIYELAPTTIFLPCFNQSFVGTDRLTFPHTATHNLYDYCKKQGQAVGVNKLNNYKFQQTSNLICHLSEEYNQAICNMIYKSLQTGQLDWKLLDNCDIDLTKQYYKKKNI